MAQYVIRKNKIDYELAKFEDTDTPIDVYTVSNRGCNCPSRYKSCKHTKIVNTWKSSGEPIGVVYDDSADVIGRLHVS